MRFTFITQPATFLFAIPAVGLLTEIFPITFGRRTPARGFMYAGLALVGVAVLQSRRPNPVKRKAESNIDRWYRQAVGA